MATTAASTALDANRAPDALVCAVMCVTTTTTTTTRLGSINADE
jgi:hypothetical protein